MGGSVTKPISRKMAVDCLLYRFLIPCGICGKILSPGDRVEFDHIHSDVMDGPHEYKNLRPVHYAPCHQKKTGRDIAANAKVKRILGLTCNKPKKKIPSRPWPKRA